jgi:2-polyprenyl-3-methyl-5-hydroxy-6-metoxy-1,4-benzoquinol methylase
MNMNDKHLWAKHASHEIDVIWEYLNITPRTIVLDFGCGKGRHLRAIMTKCTDAECVGVDMVDRFISEGRRNSGSQFNITLQAGDCRFIDLGKTFDVGLCLYDVIGSYADNKDNIEILKNLAKHIKSGGRVAISVMNYTLTEKLAKHRASMPEEVEKLVKLSPSRTMKNTGNIFNPEYFLLDEKSRVVFRKEQFDRDLRLPAEIIVTDRRYEMYELEEMCADVGFEKIKTFCVQSAHWDVELPPDDQRAKEVVYIGRKK